MAGIGGICVGRDQKGIELRAASKSGLFYGEQTLRQLYTSKGSLRIDPR